MPFVLDLDKFLFLVFDRKTAFLADMDRVCVPDAILRQRLLFGVLLTFAALGLLTLAALDLISSTYLGGANVEGMNLVLTTNQQQNETCDQMTSEMQKTHM